MGYDQVKNGIWVADPKRVAKKTIAATVSVEDFAMIQREAAIQKVGISSILKKMIEKDMTKLRKKYGE